MDPATGPRALVLVCTLKPSPAPSSSDLIGRQLLEALGEHGLTGDVVRVVDHDVSFGVSTGRRRPGSCWSAPTPSSPRPTVPAGCR